jgi:hypothetical protein
LGAVVLDALLRRLLGHVVDGAPWGRQLDYLLLFVTLLAAETKAKWTIVDRFSVALVWFAPCSNGLSILKRRQGM